MDKIEKVDEIVRVAQKIMRLYEADKVPPVIGQSACLAVCAISAVVAGSRHPKSKAMALALHHEILDRLADYYEERIAAGGGVEAILATMSPPPEGSP